MWVREKEIHSKLGWLVEPTLKGELLLLLNLKNAKQRSQAAERDFLGNVCDDVAILCGSELASHEREEETKK